LHCGLPLARILGSNGLTQIQRVVHKCHIGTFLFVLETNVILPPFSAWTPFLQMMPSIFTKTLSIAINQCAHSITNNRSIAITQIT
jgi:hypothetical protein